MQTKAAVKYMVVTLDTKITFGEHIQKAADKVAVVTVTRVRVTLGDIVFHVLARRRTWEKVGCCVEKILWHK